MTDLTPLERERMTTIFRMTSLGINVRPLFILGLGLHHCISFVRPFDGEELWVTMADTHHGYPGGVPCNTYRVLSDLENLENLEKAWNLADLEKTWKKPGICFGHLENTNFSP